MQVLQTVAVVVVSLAIGFAIVERAIHWSFNSQHVVVPLIIVIGALALLAYLTQTALSWISPNSITF